MRLHTQLDLHRSDPRWFLVSGSCWACNGSLTSCPGCEHIFSACFPLLALLAAFVQLNWGRDFTESTDSKGWWWLRAAPAPGMPQTLLPHSIIAADTGRAGTLPWISTSGPAVHGRALSAQGKAARKQLGWNRIEKGQKSTAKTCHWKCPAPQPQLHYLTLAGLLQTSHMQFTATEFSQNQQRKEKKMLKKNFLLKEVKRQAVLHTSSSASHLLRAK